ncbi:MAG: GHMP kinase [Flavobacteriia bacterium]|nr:MAG: GHMP kinase [Flavobacteriia bacterium]
MHKFYSNGKLLLTAEYVVLDGAKALALPVKFGQELRVEKIQDPVLKWRSYKKNGKIWFSCNFKLKDLSFTEETDQLTALTLQNILKETRVLNPGFLHPTQGSLVETFLNFPRDWGLGTSSTLINNIAQWARVNPYTLLYKSFGGSGYDIACAQHDFPILFQKKEEEPLVEEVNFNPDFKDQLFFVFLNKKQISSKEIKKYKAEKKDLRPVVEKIDILTEEMITCKKLNDFEKILATHEEIIASVIKREPVQKKLFPDYFGQTKSLGAWGGDFILATGNEDTPEYFIKKGYPTLLPYKKMIL